MSILHIDYDRSRRAVRDAINGDKDRVEPAVNRALNALANEQDEHHITDLEFHQDVMQRMEEIAQRQVRLFGTLFALVTVGFSTIALMIQVGLPS